MINLPSRRAVMTFVDERKPFSVAPVHVGRVLPIAVRTMDLVRYVRPSTSVNASIADRDRTLKGSRMYNSILKNLIKRPGAAVNVQSEESSSGSTITYWASKAVSPPWKATLGYVLHQRDLSDTASPSKTAEKNAPSTRNGNKPQSREESLENLPPIFAPQARSLTSILSYFDTFRFSRGVRLNFLPSQLVVRLIPSPLVGGGLHIPLRFPKIEIVFDFETQKSILETGMESGAETEASETNNAAVLGKESDTGTRFEIDQANSVVVTGINALLHETAYDVALPGHSVDLRFTKEERVPAMQSEVMKDKHFGNFIETIVKSIRSGGDLRAPPRVELKVPAWTVRGKRKPDTAPKDEDEDESKASNEDVKHEFFFAGFEYRSRRRFVPTEYEDVAGRFFSGEHTLNVNDIEAGISGGRRTEVFVRQGARYTVPSTTPSLSEDDGRAESQNGPAVSEGGENSGKRNDSERGLKLLLRTAFTMVETVDDALRGTLKPLKLEPAEAASRRKRQQQEEENITTADKYEDGAAEMTAMTGQGVARQDDTGGDARSEEQLGRARDENVQTTAVRSDQDGHGVDSKPEAEGHELDIGADRRTDEVDEDHDEVE